MVERKTHRLVGARNYIVGPMDRCPNGGVEWRRQITPHLEEMGIVVLDPTKKPFEDGKGDESDRATREKWLQDGDFDSLANFMKEVRGYDLRMVNIADFVIVYIDTDIFMWGSCEEVALAVSEKKPVLVWCKQGKTKAPWWLFAQTPSQFIFSSMEDLLDYLRRVDSGEETETYRRWFFLKSDVLYHDRVLSRLQQ